MKKILFSIFFCMLSFITIEAQQKEKGFFIEMNAGYGQNKGIHKDKGYAILAPSAGYKFNGRWLTGVKLQFETGTTGYKTMMVYAQYHFLKMSRFGLFGEVQVAYSSSDGVDGGLNGHADAGFTLGASYALSKCFSLLMRYPYIGYSGDHYGRDQGASLYGGDFVIDANLRRLQVGLQFTF